MKTRDKAGLDTGENLNKIESEVERLKHENEELKAKVKFYEEQFRLSQAKKYGPSSDKVLEDQTCLFNEAELESQKKMEEPDIEEILYKRRKARSKSRKTYEDLEVEEIYYQLEDGDRACPSCDNQLHEMKVIIRKELKVIPAKVTLVHHKRQVYACRHCDSVNSEGENGTIVTAPMPNPVLPGSMVSPTLLATILDMKYNKMMPLYRQEQAFVDIGIDIPRQNMASWVIKGSERWLTPLYDRMREHLLREEVVHADETSLNCLDEKDNKKNYMWLYATGERAEKRIYLYDYQKSRSNKHPKEFLRGFEGFLQTDGYAGYNSVENVTRLGCLAHARRYFSDALKALPKEAELSASKANQALKFFKEIYKLEDEYSDLSSEERYEKRLENTKPILDGYRRWLEDESKKTLPKSKLGEAINYSLKQWDSLVVFLKDGRLSCDNNLALYTGYFYPHLSSKIA